MLLESSGNHNQGDKFLWVMWKGSILSYPLNPLFECKQEKNTGMLRVSLCLLLVFCKSLPTILCLFKTVLMSFILRTIPNSYIHAIDAFPPASQLASLEDVEEVAGADRALPELSVELRLSPPADRSLVRPVRQLGTAPLSATEDRTR